MKLISALRTSVLGLYLLWAGIAQADGETLDEFMLFLTQNNPEVIADIPRVMSFREEAYPIYSDHLLQTWRDDELRGYLSARLGTVMRFTETGEPVPERFERVLGLMPLAMSARGDWGAFQLPPEDLAAYVSALHDAFLVEADKGLSECLNANLTYFGDSTEGLYAAAIHKITLMRNMTPADLQTYLTVQRAGARADLASSKPYEPMTEAEVDAAFAHIDPVLDRLVSGHPNEAQINAYWYDGLDDPQAECDAFQLDWHVLPELQGEGLHLASRYYLEFFLGEN